MKKKYCRSIILFAMAVVLCLVPSLGFSIGTPQGYAVDFGQSQGHGINDPIQFRMNDIRLDLEAVNPLTGEPMVSSQYFDILWEYDYAKLALVPVGIPSVDEQAWESSRLILEITDALTGEVIQNAEVLYNAHSLFSNASGIAVIEDIMSGDIQLSVSAEGYISQDVNFEISSGEERTRGVALMPTGNTGVLRGDIRIILTWGEHPDDLDSHLTGPRSGSSATDSGPFISALTESQTTSSDRFHVYYANKNSTVNLSGETVRADLSIPAMLDVDDITSYGPETITIVKDGDRFVPGLYRYTVHHFSGESDIMHSGALVNIYQGDQLIRTYSPPQFGEVAGAYTAIWTVVEIRILESGEVSIAPVNTYGTTTDEGSIQSLGSSYLGVPVQSDKTELFRNLPTK